MQYSALSKPGMGDPSWYEWSVGLSYIIDMFHDDSGIDYVELQAYFNSPEGQAAFAEWKQQQSNT